MQIKPSIVMGTLVITEHNGGYIHTDDNWPKSLDIHHVLRALCGPASEDGWYSYWEGDRKWIAKCLQAISGMTAQQIGAMAQWRCAITPVSMGMTFLGRSWPLLASLLC